MGSPKVLPGAIAGLAATVPMTLAMEGLWRCLPHHQRYPLPPRNIIDSLLPGPAETPLEDRQRRELTVAAHFAFGAAAGAVFPLLTDSRRMSTGVAYGAGVWAASYLGWVPGAGILRPAYEHPARRNLLMIGVHFIWGAGTVLALRGLERRIRS